MGRKYIRSKRVCKHCNNTFEIVPYKVKNGGGKFCSRQCYQEWNQGPNNPHWNHIERICETCREKFEVKQSQIKWGRGRFCSRKCQSIWQSENKKSKKNLRQSGKNKKESTKSTTIRRIQKRISKICEHCGKTFEIIPSESKRGGGRFCSRECVNNYQCGENHPQWKGGKTKRPSSKKKYPTKKFRVKKSRPGLIYFLLADNGLYKIGRTKKLQKRISNLGIQLPYDLELVMVIQADDMYWLEYEIHQRLNRNRVRGEWFELDRTELEFTKKFALAILD